MRTAMAFFGICLLLTALGIGWWSPVERTEPLQTSAVRPDASAPADPIAVEPQAEPAVPTEPQTVAEEPQVETAEADGDAFYTTANVRLRSGPSSNFSIVWTAPVGTQVRSMQVDGNWHFVTAAEYEGWVYNRYLTDQPR